MGAISLWQPWASAVALGAKRVETRHWPTDYRRPLAIHAAKRRVLRELIHYGSIWQWQGAFYSLRGPEGAWVEFEEALPFGAIVAVCTLSDCRPTDSFTVSELDTPRSPEGVTLEHYAWTERMMGDFSLGRFGWVLTDIRPLPEPVPFVGRQGFFNVPDELLKEAA